MSAEEFFATPENVPAYLVRRGLLAPGEPISVAELGGGVSNIVLRIESGDRRWVLKQSLAKLRVKDDWQSDRARIFRENFHQRIFCTLAIFPMSFTWTARISFSS